MEVAMVGSDSVEWKEVKVRGKREDGGGPCCSHPKDIAGSLSLPLSDSLRLYVWRLHKVSPNTLELLEVSGDEKRKMLGLQIVFEEPLSPFVSIYSTQANYGAAKLNACVITVSGVMFLLNIKAFSSYQHGATLSASDVSQSYLTSEVQRLEFVSAFSVAAGGLCLGGKNGSILCFPFGQAGEFSKEVSFELREEDKRPGSLWGLLARPKIMAPVKVLCLRLLQSRMILLALHDDGCFRIWDLVNHSLLFSCNNTNKELEGCTARMMWVQESLDHANPFQLAFLFDGPPESGKETIHLCGLNLEHGGKFNQDSLLVVQTLTLQEGKVLDAKFMSDHFWVLQDLSSGHFKLINFTPNREILVKLQEDEVAEQLLQGPNYDWNDFLPAYETILACLKDGKPPLSGFFLNRLLQPGVFQAKLLREVLEAYRRRFSESEFSSLTKDGLCKEILVAVEAESSTESKSLLVKRWEMFCNDYFLCWKKNNLPYALLSDSTSGGIGVIRRSSFSILCSLTGFEKLYTGGSMDGCIDKECLPLDWQEKAEVLRELHRCMGLISSQLGDLKLSILMEALKSPVHIPLPELISIFLKLLDTGCYLTLSGRGVSTDMGIDDIRKKKKRYHLQQRTFELQILRALQSLQKAADNRGGLVDVIEKYVEYFSLHLKGSFPNSATNFSNGYMRKETLTKAASQVSKIQFEAARDLLLLLGYTLKIKGQIGIGPIESSSIQLHLIPRLREMALQRLLVFWLSNTFVELPASEDFNTRLSSLCLDGLHSKVSIERINTGMHTLIDILMPSFMKETCGQIPGYQTLMTADALLSGAKMFMFWIVRGNEEDLVPSLCGRVVALSSVLLQHGQYGVLEVLLTRIQDWWSWQKHVDNFLKIDGEWRALLHFLGFSLLAHTRTSLKDVKKDKQVRESIRCFFRAASGFGEAQIILQDLFQQTGSQSALQGGKTDVVWKLHYLEWAMQIFEQYNFNEGAREFAYAALQQAEQAATNLSGDPKECLDHSLAIKGCLWSNIFKLSLDLRLFKEAYCAIISNPDHESKYICLRRFIIFLCECKSIEVLCGSELPYVNLLDKVEQELVWKAEHSDISAKPNPYKLLYAFHMHRHNCRSAALCMYRYTQRMKAEGLSKSRLQLLFVLKERMLGLASAITALHLVDPIYAWIDPQLVETSGAIVQSPMKRARFSADEDDLEPVGKPTRHRVLGLEDLEKDYTLTLAQLQLAEEDVGHDRLGESDMSPTDVLTLLVQLGHYDMAFSLIFKFWTNSSMKCKLEKVFQTMVDKCFSQQIDIQHGAMIQIDPISNALVPASSKTKAMNLASTSFDVSESRLKVYDQNRWRTLQTCLEKYVKIHPRLPILVAEAILSLDNQAQLPIWLVDIFKGGRQGSSHGMAGQEADPAGLLRIYLDFGRLEDAGFLLLDYMRKWANLSHRDIMRRKRMCTVWFPYTLVDRLRAHLSEPSNASKFESLRTLLDMGLHKHLKQVDIDSKDLASLTKA